MTNQSTEPTAENLKALLEKRNKLEEELRQIDQQLKLNSATKERQKERGRPVRVVVLDALEELGCVAYSREVALYVKARYGQDIPLTRFGTLGTDEKKAFGSDRSRPVYLCHGLTPERFEAIKRLWARSDWPLWTRIVAPTTGRVQHLQMTVKLCELALEVTNAASPDSLKIIAADHARALPGIRFQRGQFDLEEWRKIASFELEKWRQQDEDLRHSYAETLKAYEEESQLFGVPEKLLAAMPTLSGKMGRG